MGISVKVVPASDAEIAAFRADAEALRARFRAEPFGDDGYLTDFWDGIDFVLTAEAGDALPLGAIKRGEVSYPGAGTTLAADGRTGLSHFDACHAIFAATTQRLAQALTTLPEATLRRRFDPAQMLGGAGRPMVYPGRLWTAERADDTFRELMFYLARLRRCAAEAAQAGLGLLFYRYEDW
jgi:hypothetical protein